MSLESRAFDGNGVDRAKLLRLQSMLGAVLDEVRAVSPEDPATATAADLTRRALVEVGSAVPDAALTELGALFGNVDADLTVGECRVIDAQLLGWLGGVAMQSQWEGLRSVIAGEQEQLQRAQADAALEARRRERGAF